MAKILIIEDDPTITEGLADTLRYHDHKVYTAPTGREGIDLYKEKTPALVILDLSRRALERLAVGLRDLRHEARIVTP